MWWFLDASLLKKGAIMGILDILKYPKKNTTGLVLPNETFFMAKDNLSIHPDLIDLIWVGDGKYKNYTNKPTSNETYNFNGFSINVSSFGQDEPSLLFINLPIKKPRNINSVERPPYYPFYTELSIEQRWMYWNFLSDPYNPQNDIGYVFIFYYGLERHLLYGNFEKAFDIILKLRDIYDNKSFQYYSASALILSSMLHKRPEYALKFINSLDKEHEFEIPAELYLLCKLGLNIPITAFDLMHFHKAFGFTNTRYIKNQPDMFLQKLNENLKEFANGENCLDISKFFSASKLMKTKGKDIPIFANVSIRKNTITIPNLIQASKFTGTCFMILNKTHEDTKAELALLRKNNRSSCKKEL